MATTAPRPVLRDPMPSDWPQLLANSNDVGLVVDALRLLASHEAGMASRLGYRDPEFDGHLNLAGTAHSLAAIIESRIAPTGLPVTGRSGRGQP